MLDRRLQDRIDLRVGAAIDVGLARQRRGLHPVGGDAELAERILEGRDDPEDADRPGDRVGLGEDHVARRSTPNSRPTRRARPSRRRPAASASWPRAPRAGSFPTPAPIRPANRRARPAPSVPSCASASSTALAIVSPPAVPGPALPSTMSPATVTMPILSPPVGSGLAATQSAYLIVAIAARDLLRRRRPRVRRRGGRTRCGRRACRPARRRDWPWRCRPAVAAIAWSGLVRNCVDLRLGPRLVDQILPLAEDRRRRARSALPSPRATGRRGYRVRHTT